MNDYDSAEMSRRGKIGAFTTLSRYDPRDLTAPARARFIASFAERAQAEAVARGEDITPAEAVRRGEAARKAHYARMTRASIRARSRRPVSPEAA